MPGRRDAIQNGRLVGRCGSAGRAEGGPCRCGCTPECTSGNQCVLYALLDAGATPVACPQATADAIAAIGFAGALEGYTGMGGGFDIDVTHTLDDRYEALTYQDGGLTGLYRERIAWDVAYQTRVRFAPYPLKGSQLTDLLGPAVNPSGWIPLLAYTVYTDGINDEGYQCAALYADYGPGTGSSTYTVVQSNDQGGFDTLVDNTVALNFADGIQGVTNIGAVLSFDEIYNPLLGIYPQSNRFFAVMPGIGADGFAFLPGGHIVGHAVELARDPWIPTITAGAGIDPWDDQDPAYDDCAAAIEKASFVRRGGEGLLSESTSDPSSTEAVDARLALGVNYGLDGGVDWGFSADRVVTEPDYLGLGIELRFEERPRVTERVEHSITVVDCPDGSASLSLPALDCGRDESTGPNRLAFPCRGGAPVAYDPAAKPAGALTLVYQGVRYELTDRPTFIAAASPVVFENDPCGVVRLGVSCDDPAVTRPYNADEAPPDAQTFLAGGVSYALTTTADPGPALPVDAWLSEPCPTPGDYYIATKCDPGQIGPPEIRYFDDGSLPLGDGTVRLGFANPAIQDCFWIVHYKCTTTATDNASLLIGQSRVNQDCPADFQRCYEDTVDVNTDEICDFCQDYTGSDPFITRLCDELCGIAFTAPLIPTATEAAEAQQALRDTATTPVPVVQMMPAAAGASVGGGGLRSVAGAIGRAPGLVRRAGSYVRARASGRRASKRTISLRQLACFGDGTDANPPCSKLITGGDGRRYCGACGCGERRAAGLDPDEKGRSKLQFRELNCPLKKPGFSNAE